MTELSPERQTYAETWCEKIRNLFAARAFKMAETLGELTEPYGFEDEYDQD